MSAPTYRADIDGLRAIAIIPVVLYHASVPAFGGGFVGVDVFFVISGYLITSIIAAEMADGRFSLAAFYERRVRRLAPALFAVIVCALVIGWFIQTPTDYAALAKSTFYTLIFGSNFYFAQQGGYFDQPLAVAPMLHSWSLAVEEQFYIIWPPLLWLLTTKLWRWRGLIVSALLMASLTFAVIAVGFEFNGTFYAPHVRAWELLIGAVIALGIMPRSNNRALTDWASLAGLALIAFAVFAYTEDTSFPGLMAIPPALGAALVIWAGIERTTLTARLLATRPMVFVGLISYALYLWHWPLLAFHRGFYSQAPSTPEALAIIAVSVVLATATWHFLEKPVRQRRAVLSRKAIFTLTAVGASCVAAFTIAARMTTGFVDRFPTEIRLLTRDANKLSFRIHCPNDKVCQIHTSDPRNGHVLLWGDSHAGAILPAFVDSARSTATSLSALWRPACPPLLDVTASPSKRRAETCNSASRIAAEALKPGAFSDVVLVARWNFHLDPVDLRGQPDLGSVRLISDKTTTELSLQENHAVMQRGLARSVQAIMDSGARAWIVLTVPNPLLDVPNTMAHDLILGRAPGTGLRDIKTAWHINNSRGIAGIAEKLVEGSHGRLRVIDPTSRFCPAETCLLHIGGRPLYYDASHLSTLGAEHARELIEPIFDRRVTSADAPR